MDNIIEQEKPLYVLQKSKSRSLIPKISSLIALGTIFYLGVLLNISLLNLKANQEATSNLISLIFISLVVIGGIVLGVIRSNKKYCFYKNRIKFIKQQIFYNQINHFQIKRNFLDKIFKSYTLILTNDFQIKHIPNQVDIQNYLSKLITYSKNNPSN
jgi:hypothetical protein